MFEYSAKLFRIYRLYMQTKISYFFRNQITWLYKILWNYLIQWIIQKKQFLSKNRTRVSVRKFTEWHLKLCFFGRKVIFDANRDLLSKNWMWSSNQINTFGMSDLFYVLLLFFFFQLIQCGSKIHYIILSFFVLAVDALRFLSLFLYFWLSRDISCHET